MKTYFKYNPNPHYILEVIGLDPKTDPHTLKEVKGNNYLLPDLKNPATTGIFPAYVIGEKLTKKEVSELQLQYSRKLPFDFFNEPNEKQ